jgi:polysaccharide export outer membrane protein
MPTSSARRFVNTQPAIEGMSAPSAPRSKSRGLFFCLLTSGVLFLAACSQMPASGPTASQVQESASALGRPSLQVVDVDDRVARQLLAQRRLPLFSDKLGGERAAGANIGKGDVLEVNIWEAPPATLFGSGSIDPRQPSSVRATTLPEQTVDRDGYITVPFAGRIKAAGLTPPALEAEVARGLRGKANQPEVMVRVTRNVSSTVTVVGEVNASVRMPLTPAGERLLDALAAAGGTRQPVSKMTLQVTRGESYQSLPLDTVIRDPRQNVPLMPGDVITALFQPLSFTVLGAAGKNEEINFEAQGISLAQALARAGGLQDSRSDAKGVFVFRLEAANAVQWPNDPVATTPDGLVPVVYRVDLRNPSSFFVMQSFPMSNKDVLFVSNAPSAELQKFLNLVFSVIYPISATKQLFP